MSSQSLALLGVDVAKAKFDVALLLGEKFKTKVFDNTPAGFAALLAWLARHGLLQACFAMEATGIYHEALATFLAERGFTVFVLNPARVKRFAEASMLRAKTDSVDARLIARFVQAQGHTLSPWQPPSPELRALRDLTRRLHALKDLRRQEANRLELPADARVGHSLQEVLELLERQIRQIERAIAEHIKAHAQLKAQYDLLLSIPGLAMLTIAILLAELPWAQFDSAAQAGAFAGLSPRRFESGSSVKAKSRISKMGAPRLRQALYFPAITAAHHNPILKAFYQRLLANGKTKMAAIGATMRKLIHLAFGVLRSGKPFDPLFLEKNHQAG